VLFGQAIEDDPQLFTAADELEALLGGMADRDALIQFYYRRLEHVRHDEGRSGERLRLWDRLGELCSELDRREDALTAFEVALTLDPDNLKRRQALADLYLDADPRHTANAIAQHHAVLRANKRRVASYEALRVLYRRTNQPEKARACEQALDVIGMHIVDDKPETLFQPRAAREPITGASRPLGNEDWAALGAEGVDSQLSALFALVAPAFVADRARTRPPPPARDLRDRDIPPEISRVLNQVVALFRISRPPVFVDPDQAAVCSVVLRPQFGRLTPVIVFGAAVAHAPDRPSDQAIDHTELAFLLARQLADLRSDRYARLLCPRAPELAQIIELTMAYGSDAASRAGRWLQTSLHAVEYDQALAIAGRLRDRGVEPVRATLAWMAATDRTADRIGLVITGDLASCVRVLERERSNAPGEINRIVELAWASVTEDVLAVRARVERWPQRPRSAVERIA
jgi:tetratricopeptide (TPR) repeat protein